MGLEGLRPFPLPEGSGKGVHVIKNLLKSLGIGAKPEPRLGMHNPYKDAYINRIYNLLFCDDLELFRANTYKAESGPWVVLLAESAEQGALSALAADTTLEGRMRALAYNRLRAEGAPVPVRQLLGVIVEVPQPGGLDTLAAFVEGGVRYINQSGNVSVVEDRGSQVAALARELVAASQAMVDRIGPWTEKRLPPPQAGTARMTFLVSDGLYLGEGPLDALQKDPMAAPVIAKAVQLLQATVAAFNGSG